MKNTLIKFKSISAFTLVELIISLTITIIVIVPLLIFITNISSEIHYSNKQANSISKIYEIEDKISEISWEYLSWSIFINNSSSSGSDVLLFKTTPSESIKEWYIFAQINMNDMKIDWNTNIDNIWEKYFAYRKISETQLNIIEADSSEIYDLKFNLSEVFVWLILKDFQVENYNNKILELNFFNYIEYKNSSSIKKYTEVPQNNIERFILNF